MKIIVDKMPRTKTDCPYCKDESTMDYDKYTCKWLNSNYECLCVEECPYFTELKGENE